MPSRIPNLLINGASGIAVGMATNILPHNLTEVINGIIAYIDNPEISTEELMEHIKAPDFPTGGTIYGYEGVKESFETGRGRIVVRSKAEVEIHDGNERDRIVITEIPYQVNKAVLIMKIADLVNDKKLEGIADIRDESDREGMRIVFELKRDAIANVVLNRLFKYSQLQTSFGVNNVALVAGRPKLLSLKSMIDRFVDFRHEVVVRRTKYELAQAEKRAHILEGLLIALDNLDAIIKLIRESANPQEAKDGLMNGFSLSEAQAQAILDMRLQRLTGMERKKIKEEYDQVMDRIKYYKEVLSDESLRMKIIKEEMIEIRDEYGDERRTDIVYSGNEFSIEDMIPDEDVVITISHLGYIKRTKLAEYRKQGRGGTGSKGSLTRDEDFIEHLFIASTHNYMLFFTGEGKCYWLKVHQIPEGTKTSKGRAIQNLINLPQEDSIRAFVTVKSLKDEEFLNSHYVIFSTKRGVIKKTPLEAYSRPRENGIIAISINEGDQLLEAKLTNGNNDVLLGVKSGRAIKFHESKVRSMGRTATGVRGIKLDNEKDEVVGMVCVDKEEEDSTYIFVVSENGYGKRTPVKEYRETNRGGKGVLTMKVTEKTGPLIAMKGVKEEDDLMIINRSGIAIRIGVKDISVIGRATQGVRLIKLKNGDTIAAVAKIDVVENEEDEMETDAEDNENTNDTNEE